jgi:hypothetical protein
MRGSIGLGEGRCRGATTPSPSNEVCPTELQKIPIGFKETKKNTDDELALVELIISTIDSGTRGMGSCRLVGDRDIAPLRMSISVALQFSPELFTDSNTTATVIQQQQRQIRFMFHR